MDDGPGRLVAHEAMSLDSVARYVHLCTNETIHGIELQADDQLPRSAVGKVLKKEVRKKYWHAQERMVS